MKGLCMMSPEWDDYRLLDSGGREKLERFGPYVVRRPEPQAIWDKSLSEAEWLSAGASFSRDSAGGDKGRWDLAPGMPGQWWVGYRYKEMAVRMRMGLTSFKHVGLFPEQAENWNFIYDSVRALAAGTDGPPKVLNLFAYTGGATLAAAAAGAQVTHVDSVKQVVSWARENAVESGLEAVRWITDDALKFVRREERRGNAYHGIILDPPAYGRGPDGEKWILEEGLPELMRLCAGLLAPHGFIVLNLYSMGFSPLLAKGLANQVFGSVSGERFGELYLTDVSGKALPLGVFYRFLR